MKQAASTDDAPGAPAFLSQAITSNGFLFIAGQIHALPDNTLVGEAVCVKALPLGASTEISVTAEKA